MSETPVSPEDDGIPKYADDTSYAYDVGDRPSFEDSPTALPADEPAVLPPEEIGPEEEADLSELPASQDAATADHETYVDSESGIGVSDDDIGVVVEVAPVDASVDVPPPDAPAEAGDVTLYDVDEPGDPVTRLVESTSDVDGVPSDDGMVAFESGEVEGLTQEEAAMHIVDDQRRPLAD